MFYFLFWIAYSEKSWIFFNWFSFAVFPMFVSFFGKGSSWSWSSGSWILNFDLQLPVQSVPIKTKVGILNPAHAEVYSKQHFVIKFVSDLRQVSGFLHQ